MKPRTNQAESSCTPEYDWFKRPIPSNCHLGEYVYIDTAYGFAPFHSKEDSALIMEEGSGAYDRTTFDVSESGVITIGAYTCLNGVYLSCSERITIGAHCLIAWSVVISDQWPGAESSREQRRQAVADTALLPLRPSPRCGRTRPVLLEDNVWVGFGSVIMPGVTLGRGCVVGCRSVIEDDVAPYAVVGGNPPRLLRSLEPSDRDQACRERLIRMHKRPDQ